MKSDLRTPSTFSTKYSKAKDRTANSIAVPETAITNNLMNVLLLVTCYSEGEASIRTTIDSLASTNYPDEHKLLFIIVDGMIKGAGNDKTTPEIILEMIEFASDADSSPFLSTLLPFQKARSD
jgi:cellulose synthase/poly-beta-1,6-N-acetylglucosamine synthase-like glycosyltransferase